MEQLVLYVDKRYIIGTYCSDGVCLPICMVNGESKAWLYFHEDTEHNEITFGKQYELPCLNREYHYYVDVLDNVCDYRCMFTQYEHSSELRKIFKASGMFEQFKQPFTNKKGIETYISFSENIRNASRAVFIEELKDANFDVKLCVAPFEQLVYESLLRDTHRILDGETLIISALGDNLSYHLYGNTSDGYELVLNNILIGMGMDMRERAVVEEVLQKVNINHFLKDTELEYERQRFHRLYINDWMRRLEVALPETAIPIDQFCFSMALNNKLSTSILIKDIENRTMVIVDEIVREMFKEVAGHNTERVILVGDTFSNKIFVDALRQKLNISNDKIKYIPVSGLYEVLKVYPNLNKELFIELESNFKIDASEDRKLIEEEINKEELIIRTGEIQKKILEEERSRREVEVWYGTEMQNVRDYEERHEYSKMLNACMEALKHKPGDEEAEKKRNDAIHYMAIAELESKQYADAITKAKDNLEKKQYKNALLLSELALLIRSDSEEANSIKNKSQSYLEKDKRINDFIISANVYIKQQLYNEAEKELNKVQKLSAENDQAVSLLEIIGKRKAEIRDLTEQFNNAKEQENIDLMVSISSKMEKLDIMVAKEWAYHIEETREKLERRQQVNAQTMKLREKIDAALLDDNWDQIISLCGEFLELRADDNVIAILSRAKTKKQEKEILSFIEKAEIERKNGKIRKSISIVNEALLLFPKNVRLIKLLDNLKKNLSELQYKIQELEKEKNKSEKVFDYNKAIELCKKLADYDEERSEKWKEELQKLQIRQIEKNDLEINFRRKKADLKVVIREGNLKKAEQQIISLRKKYLEYGITVHNDEFQKLLDGLLSEKKTPLQGDNCKPKTGKKNVHASKSEITSTSQKDKIQKQEDHSDCISMEGEGFEYLRKRDYRKAKRVFATTEKNSDMAAVCTELIDLEKKKVNKTLTKDEQIRLTELYTKYNVTV